MFPELLTDIIKIPQNCSKILGFKWKFGDYILYYVKYTTKRRSNRSSYLVISLSLSSILVTDTSKSDYSLQILIITQYKTDLIL